jgi:DNA polymerase-3 subunit gamma/tau
MTKATRSRPKACATCWGWPIAAACSTCSRRRWAARSPDALADLTELYDRGADPLVVMQDLLETTHFLTRIKVAPGAEGFFDGGSGEAKRAAEMATKLPVPSLTRAWQMLLKGLFEVRDAVRPIAAAEMALIRLAYAADLPPTDKLVRELLDAESNPPLAGGSKSATASLQADFGEGKSTRSRRLAPPRK